MADTRCSSKLVDARRQSELVLRFNPGTGRGFRVILDSDGSGGVVTVSVTSRVRWRSTWYHHGQTRKTRDSRGSPFRSECGRVRSRIHQELGNLIIQPPSSCSIGGRSGRRIGISSSMRTTGQVVLVRGGLSSCVWTRRGLVTLDPFPVVRGRVRLLIIPL